MDDNNKQLKELIDLQKTGNRRQLISIAVMAVLAAAIIVLAVTVVVPVTKTMSEVNVLVTDVEESMDDINKLIDNANTIMSDNAEGITAALEKVDAIDIDSLNESIQSLSDILSPLANFFNALK